MAKSKAKESTPNPSRKPTGKSIPKGAPRGRVPVKRSAQPVKRRSCPKPAPAPSSVNGRSNHLPVIATSLKAGAVPGLQDKIKELVRLAQEQGYLTYTDLNDALPETLVAAEQLDEIYIKLRNLEIEIVDPAEVDRIIEDIQATLLLLLFHRLELDKIFSAAGFEWREPGCSMCLAMNADKLEPGERCASTSNRNFEGRQGQGGRTHLVSPAMAAAAACAGHFVDVRNY